MHICLNLQRQHHTTVVMTVMYCRISIVIRISLMGAVYFKGQNSLITGPSLFYHSFIVIYRGQFVFAQCIICCFKYCIC